MKGEAILSTILPFNTSLPVTLTLQSISQMHRREEEEEARRRLLVSKEADCERLGLARVPLFVAAPMVRYSKLPFRRLVRRYGCDLVYTPMIYADCFVKSEKCRQVEFQPAEGDWPIVQFAAKTPEEFAAAAELVYGHCRGIDLNCGCPKRDVRSEGYGSRLLDDPQLIADIVRQCTARVPDPDFSISIKIRIQFPLERTVDLCRKAERAGVSHISVHARTVEQRNEQPDYSAVALVKQALDIPVFANGNCKSYEEALRIARLTGADGVMAANGLLENPALFARHPSTPRQCVRDWLELAQQEEVPFELFHHLLVFMLRSSLPKQRRLVFNGLRDFSSVRQFLDEHYFDDNER